MKDENCIFCKIISGEIPSRTIYQDDEFQVIMDAAPATRGHALILPREHYANLCELPEGTAAKVLPLAKRLAVRMTEVLACDGLNLVQNNGEAAGQTVHHFHMHLIPRYFGGRSEDVTWGHETFSDRELDEIEQGLKEHIN